LREGNKLGNNVGKLDGCVVGNTEGHTEELLVGNKDGKADGKIICLLLLVLLRCNCHYKHLHAIYII
jgi:hypothetical protein